MLEVVNDVHLHERGSLRWIDHPEYGRMVVPISPLRFEGEDGCVPYQPSSPLGADTERILAERLGLQSADIERLRTQQVL